MASPGKDCPSEKGSNPNVLGVPKALSSGVDSSAAQIISNMIKDSLQSRTGASSTDVPQSEGGTVPCPDDSQEDKLGKHDQANAASIKRLAPLMEEDEVKPMEEEAKDSEVPESPHNEGLDAPKGKVEKPNQPNAKAKAKARAKAKAVTKKPASKAKAKAKAKARGRPRIPDSEKVNGGKRRQGHRSRPRIVVPKVEPEPGQQPEEDLTHSAEAAAPEERAAENDKPLRTTFAGRIPPSTSGGKEFFENLKAIHKEHAPPTCKSEKMQRQLWKHVKEGAGFGCGKSEMKALCLQFFKSHSE